FRDLGASPPRRRRLRGPVAPRRSGDSLAAAPSFLRSGGFAPRPPTPSLAGAPSPRAAPATRSPRLDDRVSNLFLAFRRMHGPSGDRGLGRVSGCFRGRGANLARA